MIIYKCKCGDEFIAGDNTEIERRKKVDWKLKHRTHYGYDRQEGSTEVNNPGHGYTRQIGRKHA